MADAYPLCWPANWRRTAHPARSVFRVSLGATRDELVREVRRMGGTNIVISTNVEVKADGMPYANRRPPLDPGVAVYFIRDKQQQCFPCDKWDCVEDNIHAICKTINALRGIERWGSGKMMEAAFTGFKALPDPDPGKPWWEVLKSGRDWSDGDVESMYKQLAFQHHPDRGGDVEEMTRINNAYSQFKKERNLR